MAERRGGIGAVPPSFAPFFTQPSAEDGDVARARIGDQLFALCASMPAGPDSDGIAGYVTLFLAGKAAAGLAAPLRVVASAAGVECLRRGAGRSQARRTFWERFLSGNFPDVAAMKDEASAAGIALAPTYVAALFDVEGAPAATAREALAQALASTEAACPAVSAGGHVLALFPVRHQTDVARARQAAANAVRDLPAQKAARSLTAGIGGHHADPLDAPRSYREARQALALGRRLNGRGSVTQYADLGLHALLHAGADREAFARFADATIEPLAQYDRKHKTDLLKTLRLYFEVGENVKEAAERLSVHRHTIFYRLNQIAQILKIDLRAPRDQLGIRAALAIRQMQTDDE
jgi:purine catabolism regulator